MAETEIEKITTIDPETEFLASKIRNGNEWETFKENVRPLKRGRNVNLLNHALNSHTDNELKKSLMEQRRFVFIPTLHGGRGRVFESVSLRQKLTTNIYR